MIELQSKCTQRKNFGVMGSLSGVLGGPYFGAKITKMPKIGLIWDPLKSHSVTPEPLIFFCGYILTVIQPYFTEKRFEGHVIPKNVNFHKFLVLYKITSKTYMRTKNCGCMTNIFDFISKLMSVQSYITSVQGGTKMLFSGFFRFNQPKS